jgi:NADPH-dependent ferric siderophore reductase
MNLVDLIHVTEVSRTTPRMARITFEGKGLDDFPTWPDQQLKLCFPRPGQAAPRLPEEAPEGDGMRWYQAFLAIPEEERPWMRSFTVRAYDADRQALVIDFVLHGDGGPASRWAARAKPGDTLGRYGPAAIYARPLGEADTLLLIGDATALPAIGSLIESLPEGARAIAYIDILGPEEEQRFDTRGNVTVHWLHRGSLLDAVRAAELPAGSVFAWIAGEATVVRSLRRHLVQERGMAKKSVDFTGYWRHTLTQDDAPTTEDLAEAQERLAEAQSQ